MNKTPIKIMALAAAIGLIFASCARTPPKATSQKVIQKYFNKYGKKYPDTSFGNAKVTEVDIMGVEEIHKNLVAIQAYLTLSNGNVQRVNATVERGPLGWRFVSWENDTNL